MRLLAPFANASELVEMPNVYPLPRMPANLLGLVNLHGRIVPLFDLAALFETQHLPREKRMLLVIGADRNQLRIEFVEIGLSLRELAQLLDAERSPVSAIEIKHNFVSLLR